MSNELPGGWGDALSEKGVHSYGDLAAALGISKGTAHRLVTGKTSPSTIKAAAEKFFAGDANVVLDLRRSTLRGFGPWEPPQSVLYLNPKQRSAIEAVIAAMIPEEGGAEDDGPATTKTPDVGPGDQPTPGLSVVPDRTDDAVAALDEEVPTVGEHEESDDA